MPLLSSRHPAAHADAVASRFAPRAFAPAIPVRIAPPRRIAAETAKEIGWWPILALLLAAAFAIRASQFGNPLIHVDENFYLLVGDRMLHGALPYVDIWDRKPIGLFLIYAGIRLLGGQGIVEYQVVATLFAGATAFVIARLAARVADRSAAVLAGVMYLLLLGFAGGMGGQAPVFFNLFVAAAALTTLDAWMSEERNARHLWWRGAIAMTLIGVALQVKYSAVFEGLFLGLAFVRLALRATDAWRVRLAMAAGWAGLALTPTALAFAWYASIGEAHAFVYANVLSIFARHADPVAATWHRIGNVGEVLALPAVMLILAIAVGAWRGARESRRAYAFVLAWLAAAVFGFVVFGTWFDHYMLPLFAPLAIACAPLFGRRDLLGASAAGVMLLVGSGGYALAVRHNQVRGGGEPAMREMVEAIRPRLSGCLFVYDGDPMLYHLTGSCIPTRYAFPEHLSLERERGAIGADALAEVRRVMALHPRVVVDSRERDESMENPVTNRLVRARLRRDYRLVAQVPCRKGFAMIYERRSG